MTREITTHKVNVCNEAITVTALTKLEEAMHWLHHRTRGRVARGVEGTMAK